MFHSSTHKSIKYSRVFQVTVAKNLPPNRTLPFCNLFVKTNGVHIETLPTSSSASTSSTSLSAVVSTIHWPIDQISYGVQDLVYTRVFAMIVVKDEAHVRNDNPFEVHAFVCDSRAMARKLTYGLAAAFQEYSRKIKEAEENNVNKNNTNDGTIKRKFAIDLRSPEELQQESHETEA